MELPNTDQAFTSHHSTYKKNDGKVEVTVIARFRFSAEQSMKEIQQWLDENIPLGINDRFSITGVDIVKGED